MSNRAFVVALSLCLAAACTSEKKEPVDTHRFRLNRITQGTFEVVPNANQKPYCLAFTTSDKGTIRQLTMSHENMSMKCDSGQPISGLRFRAPLDEGKIKVHVFFSDQKISAASVGQQIYDMVEAKQDVSALGMRIPGQVEAETQEFTPEQERTTQTGAEVGVGGQLKADGGVPAAFVNDAGVAQDAGTPSMDAGAK